MPKIIYTYPRDVERYGSDPVEVPEVVARRAVLDRRAALACIDCPSGCALCPLPAPEPAPDEPTEP